MTDRGLVRRRVLVYALAVFLVVLINLHQIFLDALWHDDGAFYLMSSNGAKLTSFSWRPIVLSKLLHYADFGYTWGMTHLGLPVTRLIVLVLMGVNAALMGWVFAYMGLPLLVSVIAGVIANSLPSLQGMPVGLNASYPVWGLCAMLIALRVLVGAVESKRCSNRVLVGGLGLVLYLAGMHLTPVGIFVVPFMVWVLLSSRERRLSTWGFVLAMVGIAVYQAILQMSLGHKTPAIQPLSVALERLWGFLQMSDFMLWGTRWVGCSVILLLVIGIGQVVYRRGVWRELGGERLASLRIGIALLLFFFGSVLAYLVVNPSFRVYDYAYVSNHALVVILVSTCAGLCAWLIRKLPCKRLRTYAVPFALLFILLLVGLMRFVHRYGAFDAKESMECTVQRVREGLSEVPLMPQAQVLVLGRNLHVPHAGEMTNNSGVLRYILRRNDVYGFFGQDQFGLPLGENVSFFEPFSGVDWGRPLRLFRMTKDGLVELHHLLFSEYSDDQLKWLIYRTGPKYRKPAKEKTGSGYDSLVNLLNSEYRGLYEKNAIAFAPKETDQFHVLEESVHSRVMPREVASIVSIDKSVSASIRDGSGEKSVYLRKRIANEHPLFVRFDKRLNRIAVWRLIGKGDTVCFMVPKGVRKIELLTRVAEGTKNILQMTLQ